MVSYVNGHLEERLFGRYYGLHLCEDYRNEEIWSDDFIQEHAIHRQAKLKLIGQLLVKYPKTTLAKAKEIGHLCLIINNCRGAS